jgi:hypothetical protein
MPRIHLLERRQRVELPVDRTFAFYGDALNLERITPTAATRWRGSWAPPKSNGLVEGARA